MVPVDKGGSVSPNVGLHIPSISLPAHPEQTPAPFHQAPTQWQVLRITIRNEQKYPVSFAYIGHIEASVFHNHLKTL